MTLPEITYEGVRLKIRPAKKPGQFRTSQMPSYVSIDAFGGDGEKTNLLVRVFEEKKQKRAIGFRLTGLNARKLAQWLERYADWAENHKTQGER